MRLLERLLIDVIGRYVPGVDREALRVNILQRRASLTAIDLCPLLRPDPAVFVLLDVPFELVRPSTLALLNISLPGSIRAEASGLHLRFVHVPFRRAPHVPAVTRCLDRLKRASLAEGERQATGLFANMLQTFLPVLMDSLHISVTDITAIFELSSLMSIHVVMDSVQTTRDTAYTAAEGGGLAKDIVVRGLSISLGDTPLFSLVECVLMLRNKNGAYDIDVRIPDPLRLSLGDALVCVVSSLRAEATLWASANSYHRPDVPASANGLRWWRYAVRVVMRSGGGNIESDFGRSRLRRCVEYHRLHLDRLNRGDRVSAAVREKCRQLEMDLDVETLLLVRARARKAVLAEKAIVPIRSTRTSAPLSARWARLMTMASRLTVH
jgi:hypothetical protein